MRPAIKLFCIYGAAPENNISSAKKNESHHQQTNDYRYENESQFSSLHFIIRIWKVASIGLRKLERETKEFPNSSKSLYNNLMLRLELISALHEEALENPTY